MLSVLHFVYVVVEIRLYHPVIRKEFAGLVITTGVGQLGVFRGVLDILVPHPVLHELQLPARVKQMRSNGMLEAVELALLRRQACFLAIRVHGTPEGASIWGRSPVRDEEIRRTIGPGTEVRPELLDDVRLHGVDARERSFQAMDGDPPLLQVHVGAL